MGRRPKLNKTVTLRVVCQPDTIKRFMVYKEYNSFRTAEEALLFILDLAENKAKAERPGYPF